MPGPSTTPPHRLALGHPPGSRPHLNYLAYPRWTPHPETSRPSEFALLDSHASRSHPGP